MNQNAINPTVRNDGDTIVSTHPAFGMIRFGRTNGKQTLFGSEVENAGYVSVEIKHGEENWHLHEKHYSSSGHSSIVRLAMSYAQFAEAITNQNCGEGVPCTLEYLNGQRVPQIKNNTVGVSDQIKLDIKEKSAGINNAVNDLKKQINELSVSGKQKGVLIAAAEKIQKELNSNLPFIIDQCEEAVEHITTRSKIEVEAFAQGRIRELGIQALAEKQGKLIGG
jgi:hypothetical protein